MPKVTIKQKKTNLYEKYKTTQKGKTRKQISKYWEKYRGQKYVITALPKYRKKLYKAKYKGDEIQEAFLREQYFEKKEIKVKRVEYGDLIPTRKKKYPISQQDYYKLRTGADLDNTVSRVFDNPKIRYVLVTLKIKIDATGQIIYASNTYTRASIRQLQERGEETVLENCLDKMTSVHKYKGFTIISTHIRTVYDR